MNPWWLTSAFRVFILPLGGTGSGSWFLPIAKAPKPSSSSATLSLPCLGGSLVSSLAWASLTLSHSLAIVCGFHSLSLQDRSLERDPWWQALLSVELKKLSCKQALPARIRTAQHPVSPPHSRGNGFNWRGTTWTQLNINEVNLLGKHTGTVYWSGRAYILSL